MRSAALRALRPQRCRDRAVGRTPADDQQLAVRVRIAGRIMSRRVMGKASFVHVQDMSGRIQLYVQRDALPDGAG